MDINDQTSWFARQPPSHLVGLVSGGCPELGLGRGGHGEEIAIGFRLKCECGNDSFSVSAYRWQSSPNAPQTLLSPIEAVCSDCGTNILVFDSDKQGYDPVACKTSSIAHGEREKEASKEKIEAGKSQTVDILAYYPADLFEADWDDLADRRSDLFTWLRIVIGENTEPDYPFLDFECA